MQENKKRKKTNVLFISGKEENDRFKVSNEKYILIIDKLLDKFNTVVLKASGKTIKRLYDIRHSDFMDAKVKTIKHDSFRESFENKRDKRTYYVSTVELTIERA